MSEFLLKHNIKTENKLMVIAKQRHDCKATPFLIIFFTVQWLSQDFKGDLDIDYIWVFISFYVNMG